MSKYEDKPGYSCVGPEGPPYNKSGRCDFSCQFEKIAKNIRKHPKNAECFKNQAVNLFNIMKKNKGASGLKTRKSVMKKVGKDNMDAYCDVFKTYHKTVSNTSGYHGKYCPSL